MTGDCNIFNPVLLPYLPIYRTILSGIAYFKRKVFFPPNKIGKIHCVLYSGAFYSRANMVALFSDNVQTGNTAFQGILVEC